MSKKKKRTNQRVWRDLQRSSGPTLLKAEPISKLHWILQVSVQLSLDHLWGWRLHSLSGPHSSFWPPSPLNMFPLYLVTFPVLQLCLLPLIIQHLIKYLQKVVRSPQSQLYSRLTKLSSPSLSLQGKCSSPTILGTSCWTPSSSSRSFLHCRPKTGHRCDLRSAKKRGGIICLNLLVLGLVSLGRRTMTEFYKLSKSVGKLNAEQLFIKSCNAKGICWN